MSDRLPDVCSNCGTELQDEIAGESTQPCPKCGSTKRTQQLQIQPGHMQLTGSEVELKVIRAWDSNSLTLDGVIYGIVVTVIGVVIATFGTLPTFIYAVVVLVLLAAGVLLWRSRSPGPSVAPGARQAMSSRSLAASVRPETASTVHLRRSAA
jgi:hypothetical protein